MNKIAQGQETADGAWPRPLRELVSDAMLSQPQRCQGCCLSCLSGCSCCASINISCHICIKGGFYVDDVHYATAVHSCSVSRCSMLAAASMVCKRRSLCEWWIYGLSWQCCCCFCYFSMTVCACNAVCAAQVHAGNFAYFTYYN
jgi:hypothetical protein